MTESLADLISKRDYEEPPEVQIIKDFIRTKFSAGASVTIQETQILIEVKGSALAGALRMHAHELKKLCGTDKRLIIKIS